MAIPTGVTDHSAHVVFAPEMRGKFDSDLASSVFTEDREARERTLRYLDQMPRLGDGVLPVPELDVLPDGRRLRRICSRLDLIVGAVRALAAVGMRIGG